MSAYLTELRFTLLNVLIFGFILALAVGGVWIGISYISVLAGSCVLDEGIGDGVQELSPVSQWIYNTNLYLTLPLLITLTVVYLHHLTTADPVGLVQMLSSLGIEFESEARSGSWGLLIAATFGA